MSFFKKIFRSNYGEENSFEEKIIESRGLNILTHIHRVKNNNNVIIMYPGAEGSIEGYNSKYIKIANLLQSKGVANIIRLDNKYDVENLPYYKFMIDKLVNVVDYVYKNSEELFGVKSIKVSLAGVSAGAGAILKIIDKFPDIEKVLLVSPVEKINKNVNYKGEVYLIAGENDEMEADKVIKQYYNFFKLSKSINIKIIPNCDHQFKGRKNGKVFLNSYLWAFN